VAGVRLTPRGSQPTITPTWAVLIPHEAAHEGKITGTRETGTYLCGRVQVSVME
jgi:hypothetical protein